MSLVLVGAVVGLAGAYAITRVMSSLLLEVAQLTSRLSQPSPRLSRQLSRAKPVTRVTPSQRGTRLKDQALLALRRQAMSDVRAR